MVEADSGSPEPLNLHDLLNGLHAAQGFLELLRLEQAGPLTERQRRYVAKSIESLASCVSKVKHSRARAPGNV